MKILNKLIHIKESLKVFNYKVLIKHIIFSESKGFREQNLVQG